MSEELVAQIGGWITLAFSVIAVVNLATARWHEVDGPWYKKVYRVLLWLVERISVVSTDGYLKIPGTDKSKKPSDDGSAAVGCTLLIVCAMAIAVVLFSGCASTLKTIDVADRVTVSAAALVDPMCEPVKATCKDVAHCEPLHKCLIGRVAASKALKSANEALRLAALAAVLGDDGQVEHWLKVAQEAARVAQEQLIMWRE
jgi:hypothetical protein